MTLSFALLAVPLFVSLAGNVLLWRALRRVRHQRDFYSAALRTLGWVELRPGEPIPPLEPPPAEVRP